MVINLVAILHSAVKFRRTKSICIRVFFEAQKVGIIGIFVLRKSRIIRSKLSVTSYFIKRVFDKAKHI